MGQGTYGLGDVSGKSHMIEWDQIVMTGVIAWSSIVVVMGHVIVTVITDVSLWLYLCLMSRV